MDLPLARAIGSRIDVLPEAGSTNALLREAAADARDWPHLSVLLTENQTAGRGRLDRSWVAPAGASLAVSVLLRRLPAEIEARGWVPLAAGMAMTDAVAEQLPHSAVSLKWPNDVMVEGRKICGVLAEATGEAVIVGTGVNTAMTSAQLPVPTATSFAVLGVEVDADRLLATYLRRLDEVVSALARTGDAVSSGLHEETSRRCATIGQEVRVSLPGDRTLEGTATRLDASGRLVVVSSRVEHPISAGDVVHVRPAAV